MEKVIKNIVIILLTQIILTTVILFVSSGIIWKYAYDEKAISAVVTGTYIVVNILGGIIAGKLFKKNKFLWGLAAGVIFSVSSTAFQSCSRSFHSNGAIGGSITS